MANTKNEHTEHIQTRRKIRDIASIDSFNGLLNSCTLSETDKKILRLHYLEEKDFRYIGDTLGFLEETIKRKHKKALQKINKMI